MSGVSHMALIGGYVAAGVTPISITRVHDASNSANSATRTYTGVSFGAAPGAGERRFIAILGTHAGNNSNNGIFSSATIDGGAAAFVGEAHGSGGGNATNISLIYRELSSGTSGNVVFNYNSSQDAGGIQVFRIITGTGGLAVANLVSDNSAPLSVSATAPSNSAFLAGAACRNGAQWSWTYLTEEYEFDFNGGEWFSSAIRGGAFTSQTVTATPATGAENVLVGASFQGL